MTKKFTYCDICGKPVANFPSRLESHKALKHGLDVPGHCKQCNATVDALHAHLRAHKIAAPQRVPCATCGVLVKETQLKEHVCGLLWGQEVDLVKKECFKCGVTFGEAKEVIKHFKEVHKESLVREKNV